MKKIVKTIVPFLVALSAVTLAGCNGNNSSTTSGPTSTSVEPTPEEKVEVTSIALNRRNISLALIANESGDLVGETAQLEAETLPRTPIKAKLTYVSSNEAVASVDQTGKVTAHSKGNAVITASSYRGDVFETCNIFVYENISKSAANKVVSKIKSAQTTQQISSNLDKILQREKLISTTTKAGVLQTLDSYDQYIYVGKKDAYVRLGAKAEKEIKVEGGSASFQDWEWIMYTNESYDTYLFHTLGATKTYMVADTTSYVGQSRYAALCAILENLFVSGAAIINNQYTNVMAKDELGFVSSSTKRGSNADNELFVNTERVYEDQVADASDESDLNIPAGTLYDVKIAEDAILENNVLFAEKGIQEITYKLNGVNYSQKYDFEYQYEIENVEFEYPNRDEYALVEDIFSL